MDRLLNEQLLKVMNDLYFYLLKLGADQELAEDIIQESVYKSMIYLESIDTDKYKAWLFKAAINLYYDHCRKLKKSSVRSVDESIIAHSVLIEDVLIEKENKVQVRRALERLPCIYKQLLQLKYGLEWSYQQIAEYLEMNPKSVKTYLARARAKFKKIYRREENEENK
ncbi:RNA polymerase sigma factor [Sporolactobacillus inulinus]|nr:sigma-70 family RNA polymerase sigma factor [Sporolactobacillus inulinus]GEB77720.1 DNA-directed RNA polymerase sigma-70 factor [Sporolactobacillus inulinus]